jgi:hypothetical protein
VIITLTPGFHQALSPVSAKAYQSRLLRQAGVLVEVLDGAVQEGDPLLQLRVEGLTKELSEAEDDADDGHPLKNKMRTMTGIVNAMILVLSTYLHI